jgi:hypothetical protein
MPLLFCCNQSFIYSGLNPTNFNVLVLGDLTWSEAYEYYLELLDTVVTPKHLDRFGRSEKDFGKVFDVTGGRMYLISNYVSQVCTDGPMKSGERVNQVCFA